MMLKLNKKGQIGFQAVAITIGVTAILLLVLVLIFSKVSNTGDALMDNTPGTILNESVTGAINTYIVLANHEEDCTVTAVYNASPVGTPLLTADNYTTTGCYINVTCDGNSVYCSGATTNVLVSYTYENTSDATTTYRNVTAGTLDSMDLIVIGLVVLAAVAILGVLFLLGRSA